MKFFYLLAFVLILVSCTKKDVYDPSGYMTPEEQTTMLRKMIRYSTQLAPRATHETKMDTAFDWYYERAIKEYDIRGWYKADDGQQYFMMSRQARSLTPMRETIAGKLRLNDKDSLIEYEEIFRTWKMPDDQMRPKAIMLFDKMVKGESLEPYYPKNAGDQYIEFPDSRYKFDKASRRWNNAEIDSVMNAQ